jgi:hypothetical protein
MPQWLVQDSSAVYLLLGLAALGLGVGWWVRQERRYALGLGVVLLLMLAVFLFNRFVVTDHEQLVQSVEDMAGSVQTKDVNRIFAHISERFKSGGTDKKAFRSWVEYRITGQDMTHLKVWDFEPGKQTGPNKQSIYFLVKAQGEAVPGETFFRCEAFFERDPDGKWRMTGFRLMNPQTEPDKAEDIPLPLR